MCARERWHEKLSRETLGIFFFLCVFFVFSPLHARACPCAAMHLDVFCQKERVVSGGGALDGSLPPTQQAFRPRG